MKAAFKEWAVVIDALGRGEQIIILRKGGIHEGRGGFKMDQTEFWLFSTLYHQQSESVIVNAGKRFKSIAASFPPDDTLQLKYFARVADWRKLDDEEAALKLEGQHIWKDSVIRDRFSWGREESIFALAVRIYKLAKPINLPMQKEYGGCKSWIELTDEPVSNPAQPVLDDDTFKTKLDSFRKALI